MLQGRLCPVSARGLPLVQHHTYQTGQGDNHQQQQESQDRGGGYDDQRCAVIVLCSGVVSGWYSSGNAFCKDKK